MAALGVENRALSRILVTSAGPFTRQIGGGQSYTQDLVSGLAARGHKVTVLEPMVLRANATELLHIGTWNAIPVWSVELPLPGETLEEQSTELSAARISLFCQVLRQIQPDVVQINGLMPTMVRACNTLGLRHVVVAHHPGETCPKGDLLTPVDTICTAVPSPAVCGPCVLRCKKGGLGLGKVLATMPLAVHRKLGKWLTRRNPLGYVGRVLYIPWLVEQRLAGLKSYLDDAQVVIAPSRAMAHTLVRGGGHRERIHVLHHGIKPLHRTPLAGIGQHPLRLGFVGRIDHAKGVHVLLRAMQQVGAEGKVELHIHGDATKPYDLVAWEAALKQLGSATWLHLHGAFAREAVETVYASIDVLVLPAICQEAFGLVVAEALSAGRPVITTHCGGPAEQVRDGLDGWVVSPNDAGALEEVIKRLAASPELVSAAATHAGSTVKNHERYLAEIESFLESKSSE